MTAKEYLQRVRKLDLAIDTTIAQIAALEAAAEKISRATDAVRVSGGRSDHDAAIVRLMAARERCNALTDEYADAKAEAVERINMIEDQDQRRLLTLYYIRRLSWDECAAKLNFSLRQTHRLHGEALIAFDRFI